MRKKCMCNLWWKAKQKVYLMDMLIHSPLAIGSVCALEKMGIGVWIQDQVFLQEKVPGFLGVIVIRISALESTPNQFRQIWFLERESSNRLKDKQPIWVFSARAEQG